jgi:hypothetical protein
VRIGPIPGHGSFEDLRRSRRHSGSLKPITDTATLLGVPAVTPLEDADLLPERSAESLAAWLAQHPEIEFLSRDRQGL